MMVRLWRLINVLRGLEINPGKNRALVGSNVYFMIYLDFVYVLPGSVMWLSMLYTLRLHIHFFYCLGSLTFICYVSCLVSS